MPLEILIELLYKLAKRHHTVNDEDCWYSCPESGECCNEEIEGCNCGATRHNVKVEDLYKEIKSALKTDGCGI